MSQMETFETYITKTRMFNEANSYPQLIKGVIRVKGRLTQGVLFSFRLRHMFVLLNIYMFHI